MNMSILMFVLGLTRTSAPKKGERINSHFLIYFFANTALSSSPTVVTARVYCYIVIVTVLSTVTIYK